MSTPSNTDKWWETTKLEDMTTEQWESLCDGCGRCCMVKVRLNTVKTCNVACKLLDIKTVKCTNYDNRLTAVSTCTAVTLSNIDEPDLLPDTCAYKLIKNGKPLYDWHYLISGDRTTVVDAGISIKNTALTNEDKISAFNIAILDLY